MPAMELIRLTRRFARETGRLRFGAPVASVYNPLEYARGPHEEYLRRYAASPKTAVFLGMNPGPFGMAQTGIPFGEVSAVRDWLKIGGKVGKPPEENRRRPVDGFACARSEVSGGRLWGAIAGLYGAPTAFFREFFVSNYCPLLFMEHGGRNVTPDKLKRRDREALFAVCDEYLRDSMALLRPMCIVGIGKFAEARARAALQGGSALITSVLHPSPACPAANRGWQELFMERLRSLGFLRVPGGVVR